MTTKPPTPPGPPKTREIPFIPAVDGGIYDNMIMLANVDFCKAIIAILLSERGRQFRFKQEHFDRIQGMMLLEGRDGDQNFTLTLRTREEVDARPN